MGTYDLDGVRRVVGTRRRRCRVPGDVVLHGLGGPRWSEVLVCIQRVIRGMIWPGRGELTLGNVFRRKVYPLPEHLDFN
jgi:hypothetical protein